MYSFEKVLASLEHGNLDAALRAMISELEMDNIAPNGGAMQIEGVVIGYKDNATSMRCKGPQHPSEGSADVQSYSGIFYNDIYDRNGGLKTRFIVGANAEMDLELQSPNTVKISGVDSAFNIGKVIIGSDTDVVFNVRTDSDTSSLCQLTIDRIDTGTKGDANTSDVNVKATKYLHLNASVTLGTAVVSSLTSTQISALTPPAGAIVFNSSTSKHQGFDGAIWNDLY